MFVYGVLSRAQQPLTGRQIERLVGTGSHRGIQLLLGRLVEHGIVDCEPAGSANVYALNRDHVAASAIEQLVALTTALNQRIAVACESWQATPVNVTLFGSAARQEGNTQSDIDLLLIRPDSIAPDDQPWANDRALLSESVERWSGNHAAVLDWTIDELRTARAKQEPLLADMMNEGITVYGTPLRTVAQKENSP